MGHLFFSNISMSSCNGKVEHLDRTRGSVQMSVGEWCCTGRFPAYLVVMFYFSKKSSAGPTERTPKPAYLIALATYLGVRW